MVACGAFAIPSDSARNSRRASHTSARGYARQSSTSDGRTRPYLRRFCAKTKLCMSHLRGECPNGSSCNFAHDASELQQRPDMSRTKFCPRFMKYGKCTRGPACTFAHSQAELRIVERIDDLDAPPSVQVFGVEPQTIEEVFTMEESSPRIAILKMQADEESTTDEDSDTPVYAPPVVQVFVASEPARRVNAPPAIQIFKADMPSSLVKDKLSPPTPGSIVAETATPRTIVTDIDDASVYSFSENASEPPSPCFAPSPCALMSSKSPRNPVVQKIAQQLASSSRALTFGELVLELNNMFRAIYHQRPEVAVRTGESAETLARATAAQAWADAGLDCDGQLCFNAFKRWCASGSASPAFLAKQ